MAASSAAANRVMDETDALSRTTKSAKDLELISISMQTAVSEVMEKSKEVLEHLKSCSDNDSNEKATELRDRMRDLNTSGENLMKSSGILRDSWADYRSSIEHIIEGGRFTSSDISSCIGKLEKMLMNCEGCYETIQVFSEGLKVATTLCLSLSKQCEEASTNKSKTASKARLVGYGATAAITVGSIAAAFLTVVTGGSAAPLAAGIIAATVAAGTGVGTKLFADSQDTMASNFKSSMEKLAESMKTLNASSEKVNVVRSLSAELRNNLEKALKTQAAFRNEMNAMAVSYQKELTEKDKELTEKDERIRDLEAQLSSLQSK